MRSASRIAIFGLLFVAGIMGACASSSSVETPTPASVEVLDETSPTPLPTRKPHPPGELVDYISQTGDTLPGLAAHFTLVRGNSYAIALLI